VRRTAAWLLAAALAGPAVLALAVPGVDSDAVRCAMKCGHAVRAGAVCCPIDAGAAWKTCRPDDSLPPAFSPAAPGVLTLTFRLAAPAGYSAFAAECVPSALSAHEAPPDPVPLALS
jgi:hypothetical protein